MKKIKGQPKSTKLKKIGGQKSHIHELEATLATLERGKYMWQSTFDAIRDPVLIIQEKYTIDRANLAAAEQAGCDVRQLVGQKCYQAFAGRKEVCPGCPLELTVKKETPHTVWIDGLIGEQDFQVSSYPFQGQDEGRAVVHHYRDVTEEKRLQRRLMQSDKMAAVGMLAGGVAHEINNPLGGILAFAQLAMSDLGPNSPALEDLKEIESAAIRCKKIVENLLDFSRQSKDSDQKTLDPVELVEGILPLIKLKLKSSGVEVHTHYDATLPKICGNSNRLQQVVMNLLTNAAHAMPKGGNIAVTIMADEDVKIMVRDEGIGMSKEVMERIFDPYFTTKTQGEGTGLGLAISYSIVSEHNGYIDVKSEVGKGSTFTLVLPPSSKEKQKERVL